MKIRCDERQEYCLRRMAALQFPGSIENYCTKHPIHLLQQRSSDRQKMRFNDAFYDHNLKGAQYEYEDVFYDSIDEMLKAILNIDGYDEEEIRDYNEQREFRGELGYYPYERFLTLGPDEYQWANANEQDYLNAYDVNEAEVFVYPQSEHFETMAIAFTHQALEDVREDMDNHIFNDTRTYAMCGERFGRSEGSGDYYPLMDFLYSTGEAFLMEDAESMSIEVRKLLSPEQVEQLYDENPEELHQAASILINDKKSHQDVVMDVMVQGNMVSDRRGGKYPVVQKRYVRVLRSSENGETQLSYYPYPFECDGTVKALHDQRHRFDKLTPIQRLYFYCMFKTPRDKTDF